MALQNDPPKVPYVLLIEDEIIDAKLVSVAWEELQIEIPIYWVRRPKQAYHLLFNEEQEYQANPILVLLDLNLKPANGTDVLAMLRKHPRTRYIPIVMFTTSSLDAEILECYRLGANSYVIKPNEFTDLLQCLDGIANYWCNINKPIPVW